MNNILRFDILLIQIFLLLVGLFIGFNIGGKAAHTNYFLFTDGDFISIFLTSAIFLVALGQFRLSSIKEEQSQKNRTLEDIIRKLEYVYGPVYNILNQVELLVVNEGRDHVSITPAEKDRIDVIFSKFSYLIEIEVRNYWMENIHRTNNVMVRTDTLDVIEYNIDNVFVDMINEKYRAYNSAYDNMVRVWKI